MRRILGKVGLGVSLIASLFFFLFFAHPEKVPLIALFIPFLLLYLIGLLILDEVTRVFLKNMSKDYRRWFIAFLALLPVGLLLTLSAGQSDGTDILLFLVFIVLILFYFSRTNFLK